MRPLLHRFASHGLAAALLATPLLLAACDGVIDEDGDGIPADRDCDDTDSLVGGEEVPYDGVDNDCDPETLDDDLDGDGFPLADDCDDEDPSRFGAEVPYDGVDNDCNPDTPDDDLDGDGLPLEDDCDDTDPDVGGDEIPYDGIDNDCDPETPDDDLDGDGFPLAEDCDDADPTVGGPEILYDDLDNDCNPDTKDWHVELVDGVLYVEGVPFDVHGVAWNPVPRGGLHIIDLDYAGFVEQDSALMAAAGINVVRTYEPITDPAVLDVLYEHGVYVFNSVYPAAGDSVSVIADRMADVVHHPAVLMWLVGNEWNYNGFYVGLDHEASVRTLQNAAVVIRSVDAHRPILTSYGGLPSTQTLGELPQVDVWGINTYTGLSFGGLFSTFEARSDKPMLLTEFGADAWNADTGSEDQAAQAVATAALIAEIEGQLASEGRGPCLGGVVFEWADEWWKSNGGDPGVHDTTGIWGGGGGPWPDGTFNEEWWGLVDIDRDPRLAYDAVKEAWGPR